MKQVLKGILNLRAMEEAHIRSGKKVRYRSGEQIKAQKASKVGNFSDTWFLKDGFTVTLKFQCIKSRLLKEAANKIAL